MRLIDADAMKQHYPIMENDFGMVFNDGLHKELDREPTVKAIPTEKLEQIKAEIAYAMDYTEPAWKGQDNYEGGLAIALSIIDKALKEVEQ